MIHRVGFEQGVRLEGLPCLFDLIHGREIVQGEHLDAQAAQDLVHLPDLMRVGRGQHQFGDRRRHQFGISLSIRMAE